MRILNVIRSLDPSCGGPTSVIRGLVPAQSRAGHQVELVSTTAQAAGHYKVPHVYIEQMRSDPCFAGCDLDMIVAFGRRKPWSTLAFAPGASRWFRRRLADPRHRPDMVLIHGVFSHILSVAASECRRQRIPYIIAPFGSLDAGPLTMGSPRLKRLFTPLFLKRDVRHMAFMAVASRYEQEQLPDWVPADRVRVIPHGVDLPSYDREATTAAFLASHPLLRGHRIILCMSRIAPIKRIELLVEALGIVRSDVPEAMLVVAGPDHGGLKTVQATVERLALNQAVMFLGFVEGDAKQGLLASADMFALTSIHENFSIATIEAMAHGLPVLVTPGVAAHVFVDESGAGRTVGESPKAIAQGMKEILQSNTKALGYKAQAYVKEHLSWGSVVRGMEEVYREMVGQKGNKR